MHLHNGWTLISADIRRWVTSVVDVYLFIRVDHISLPSCNNRGFIHLYNVNFLHCFLIIRDTGSTYCPVMKCKVKQSFADVISRFYKYDTPSYLLILNQNIQPDIIYTVSAMFTVQAHIKVYSTLYMFDTVCVQSWANVDQPFMLLRCWRLSAHSRSFSLLCVCMHSLWSKHTPNLTPSHLRLCSLYRLISFTTKSAPIKWHLVLHYEAGFAG